MYAIVQVGGRQYRAAAGSRVLVDRLQVEAGAPIVLDDVRMLVAEDGDGSATEVGTPKVDGARVSATAVSHLRGPKVVVFKYKPKKRYRRTRGFRAELTELRIERVLRKGEVEEPVETPSAAVAPASKTPRRRTPAAAKVADEAPVVAAKEAAELEVPVAAAPEVAAVLPEEKPVAKPARKPRRPAAGATEPDQTGDQDGS